MRENEHHVPEGAEPFDYLKDQVLIAGNSGSLDEMDITGVYCTIGNRGF
jgi:spore germination protein KA